MTITKEQINNYSDLVNANNYSELLLTVASDFGLETYKKLFESIITIHHIESQMNHDVYKVRERFKNEMMEYLQNELSESDYNSIKQFV